MKAATLTCSICVIIKIFLLKQFITYIREQFGLSQVSIILWSTTTSCSYINSTKASFRNDSSSNLYIKMEKKYCTSIDRIWWFSGRQFLTFPVCHFMIRYWSCSSTCPTSIPESLFDRILYRIQKYLHIFHDTLYGTMCGMWNRMLDNT